MFVSLFQIWRQHFFDPFHECADSARQIAPMRYDEGYRERPATKIRYDLHKRSALQVSANPQEWRRGLSDLWPVVYLIARKGFGFSREWSAPLASGISICGVAAAIATGGAIRARPQFPVLVSSLVVIFAVIEVLLLPALANAFMSHEPLVAAAWMGLAVKTDGAAVAAGASNNPSASSGTRKRPHCRAGRPTLPPPARPGHVRPFESQSAASRRKPGPPNRMKSPR